MATDVVQERARVEAVPESVVRSGVERPLWRTALEYAASLKLTVTLFVLSIGLVFIGTLAQVELDIWEVVARYFRAWICVVPLQVFFPPGFFPSRPQVPGAFPYPGGFLLGTLLAINLVAAHAIRFKIQAKRERLALGLAVLLLGVIVTWLVIASGNNQGINPRIFLFGTYQRLWTAMVLGVGALGITCGVIALRLAPNRRLERRSLFLAAVILVGLAAWLLSGGTARRLDDSGMRILWQLIKGGTAAAVLLLGCRLLFHKRAGIVLLHGGVGLMMFGELWVAMQAVESQMRLAEGEVTNFTEDSRAVELALVLPTLPDAPEQEEHIVVDGRALKAGADEIDDPGLPVKLRVVRFMANSRLEPVSEHAAHAGEDWHNPATAGAGLRYVAEEVPRSTGTDTDGTVDMPSAYVELVDRATGRSLGTYLVSLWLNPQPVQIGEQTYELALRFRRLYKPYVFRLLDVQKRDYIGTDTPRDYSSYVHVVNPQTGDDFKVRIWMNNPLRYAGETFYQSGYFRDPQTGQEITTLQVVTNSGWMIPYVACMIVAIGMLAHFGQTLVRYLDRYQRETPGGAGRAFPGGLAADEDGRATKEDAHSVNQQAGATQRAGIPLGPPRRRDAWERLWVPALVTVVFAVWVGSKARIPSAPDGQMPIYRFGELPVVYEGRVKPFDTLARNNLRAISGRETFVDLEGKRQPAIRWLLDVITQRESDDGSGLPISERYRVFRIDNHEVLRLLGLEPRSGMRYAIAEFRDKAEDFNEQVRKARERRPEEMSLYQRKLVDLDARIRRYTLLQHAFRAEPIPSLPTEEEFRRDPERYRALLARLMEYREIDELLRRFKPPLAVPDPDDENEPWKCHALAWSRAFTRKVREGADPDPFTRAVTDILVAYRKGDVAGFDTAVKTYRELLKKTPPAEYAPQKVHFEAFFNAFAPFYHAAVLYIIVFVLTALSWLGWRPLAFRRSGYWLMWLAFAVHTFAVVARMYISGRPPVTNLYSSAVFIGWAAV
ncbi:MAG: hypothetical protein D6725_02575, partial [Planctomycetota bacterium]